MVEVIVGLPRTLANRTGASAQDAIDMADKLTEVLARRVGPIPVRLADERQVPAYVVFSDRTLQAMTARRPGTQRELLEVHGVGQRKLEEYGELFLAEILRQG